MAGAFRMTQGLGVYLFSIRTLLLLVTNTNTIYEIDISSSMPIELPLEPRSASLAPIT